MNPPPEPGMEFSIARLEALFSAKDWYYALDSDGDLRAIFDHYDFIFAATGVGNGSTYRMIPTIWRTKALQACDSTPQGRAAAVAGATRSASAAIGIIGAVGALGGFGIPMVFGAPWVDDPLTAVRGAFMVFACFYVVCGVVTWAVYLRRSVLVSRFPSLAPAGV